MNAHAPLPSSSADIWGYCSGWLMASTQYPNLETEENRAGTAAHWVLAEVLLNFKGTQQGPLLCADYIGETAPNGVVIDDKMAEGAQVAVDDVLDIAQRHGAVQSMMIEHRVSMPGIHEHNWGTLDISIFLPKKRLVFLWDYKHGHREHRAKDKLQLIDYMEGLSNEFGIDGVQDQELTVIFRIVQPFCYRASGAVDEWVCKLSDLRGHVNMLRDKAHEAFTNPTLTSGKHCRDCPAVGKCAATRQATYNFIDVVNAPYQMDSMTGPELATERAIIEDGLVVAKARLSAIEDDLKHRIGEGEAGTGLALESSYGRLAWTVPPVQANALAGQFGFDISKLEVKTPTQAKQAAPKEVRQLFEQTIKNFTKRPTGSLKLTNADDTLVARAFKRK